MIELFEMGDRTLGIEGLEQSISQGTNLQGDHTPGFFQSPSESKNMITSTPALHSITLQSTQHIFINLILKNYPQVVWSFVVCC